MTMDVSELSGLIEPLDRGLRRKLEVVVEQARQIAETAANASLQQLGVGDASAPTFLSPAERELRKRLRGHGRQLGDQRDSKSESQQIDRLVEEVAYEHWHRMLFARFLAENGLLMYPGADRVSVSLQECEDLAEEENVRNGWELASRFARQMLPQIFRTDSPVFDLVLPPEHEQALETLVKSLPQEVFTASDSLGWIYQFWQSRRKEDVNASEVKVGARELPAVTQLFTEPYMVSFLLDNSLGAWWANRRLNDDDFLNAATEEELRARARIPGVPLKHLRFVRTESGRWITAAGSFGDWTTGLNEFKLMDPCCGSGHFLVGALLMLVPIRMELETLSAAEAINRVLAENIHGLEIDPRCIELAAFALALNAWLYPGAGGYRVLPKLNIACCGLSVNAAKDEWKQLALGKDNLRIALDWMHENFKDAPLIGSLFDPSKGDATKIVPWEKLSASVEEAINNESPTEQREAAVVAQGLATAALLMARRYDLVITNVPYLARAKQNERLRQFCEQNYPEGKNDLATVFLQRCLDLCSAGGTTSIVLPQNWLFLTSYKKLREKLLRDATWNFIARLGEGGFESAAAAGAFTVLLIVSRPKNATGAELCLAGRPLDAVYSARTNNLRGVDVSSSRSAVEKSDKLMTADIKTVEQQKQLSNPDARITFEDVHGQLLEEYAVALNGMHGGDSPRFRLYFWEVQDFDIWHFFQCTCDDTQPYAGRHSVFYWAYDGKCHTSNQQARIQGFAGWGRKGVVISMMRQLPATLYSGDKFDMSCSPIVPHNEKHLAAIWCFCSSAEYNKAVRQIDQKLNVTNGTLVKVPFDLQHWTAVAQERYPEGLPEPYSEDPTQWIFHGHPSRSLAPLQVGVARLVGYQWPAETKESIDLSASSKNLIRRCEELLDLTDEDGIVCIPALRGEASASDRLQMLLARAYGVEWSAEKLAQLLAEADHNGKSLESWLRDKFFAQHCKLFNDRPFVWHIWDGLRDGFAALVNYHRLDKKLLETLIYTYVGDWITRQTQDAANGIDGAHEKLAAAEQLKRKLELILNGEAPHDIFVRWKSLEQQPIGWSPDLSDGVRTNIRPFISVGDVGKRDAGVLRDRPKVNWNKDRGKDIASSPWYHLFKGDRINDHHLRLKEKHAAKPKK